MSLLVCYVICINKKPSCR